MMLSGVSGFSNRNVRSSNSLRFGAQGFKLKPAQYQEWFEGLEVLDKVGIQRKTAGQTWAFETGRVQNIMEDGSMTIDISHPGQASKLITVDSEGKGQGVFAMNPRTVECFVIPIHATHPSAQSSGGGLDIIRRGGNEESDERGAVQARPDERQISPWR